MGMGEVSFQDKTRTPEGMLILFESKQVSGGSGALRFEGHYDKVAREAILVAFEYVQNHKQQIKEALPCPTEPRRSFWARDMDTLINCSPVNISKWGPSCEWGGGQRADSTIGDSSQGR